MSPPFAPASARATPRVVPVAPARRARRLSVRAAARGDDGGGPGGFWRKLFTGELGVASAGAKAKPWSGDESAECAMLRANVLRDTTLYSTRLVLRYDASEHGWNARAFHDKVDNMGPAFLIGDEARRVLRRVQPGGVGEPRGLQRLLRSVSSQVAETGVDERDAFYPSEARRTGRRRLRLRRGGPHLRRGVSEDPLTRPPWAELRRSAGRRCWRGEGGQDRQMAGRVRRAGGRTGSLLATRDGRNAELLELRVYSGEGLDGVYG